MSLNTRPSRSPTPTLSIKLFESITLSLCTKNSIATSFNPLPSIRRFASNLANTLSCARRLCAPWSTYDLLSRFALNAATRSSSMTQTFRRVDE